MARPRGPVPPHAGTPLEEYLDHLRRQTSIRAARGASRAAALPGIAAYSASAALVGTGAPRPGSEREPRAVRPVARRHLSVVPDLLQD